MPALPFVATTGLKSTWPIGGPDVFLGDWCFQFGEDALGYPNSVVAPYPWSALEARSKGVELCLELTLRITSRLTPFFSTLLRDQIDGHDANLLLATAVERMVMAAYHNFVCLKETVVRYGPLRSSGLPRERYVVPETTGALIASLRSDEFQLQLFSEICPALGIGLDLRFESKSSANSTSSFVENSRGIVQPKRRLVSRILRDLLKKVSKFHARHAECILYNPSFSITETVILTASSHLRVATLPLHKSDSITWPHRESATRNELAAELVKILNKNQFENVLCRLLPLIWPISLLEGLGALKKAVADHFPSPPKTIASGMAWHVDDAFKLWCTQGRKRGSRLVGCQHGGGYGKRYLGDLDEQIEYLVVDRFVSWGGSGHQAPSCVTLPVPPHFLVRRARRTNGRILYIGTAEPRWPSKIGHFPFGRTYMEYLDRQSAFWRALPPGLQTNLLFRCNPVDLGWSEQRRLQHAVPEATVDDFTQSFNDRLRYAALAVVDNLNTTYLQCMGSGIPTILVWDPDVWAANEVAARHFEELEAAGVYYRSPQAAAAAAARIWPDPQKWWETPHVAGAVNKFLDRYMNRDRDWVGPWLRELLA